MVHMEMGQKDIVDRSPGLPWQEMFDIPGVGRARPGQGIGLLGDEGMDIGIRGEFPGVDQHRRPVREDVEGAFAPAGIDGVDVEVPLFPRGELIPAVAGPEDLIPVAAGPEEQDRQQGNEQQMFFHTDLSFSSGKETDRGVIRPDPLR